MQDLKTENYKFNQHKPCEFFPCHKVSDESSFNCLFCYCPLYALGPNCGGNFTYLSSGIKDCTNCMIPHKKENYEYITSKYFDIMVLAKKDKDKKEIFELALEDNK